MKKVYVEYIVISLAVTVFVFGTLHAANKKPIHFTPENIARALTDMDIGQGNAKYVKSAETTDKQWKAHLFRVEDANISLPLVVYTKESTKEMVLGVLIRDRKLVVPNLTAEDLQPKAAPVDVSKLSTEDRIVYNPSGKETIIMFTDPDCRFCQRLESLLATYKGKYKVIAKHFPLESIHPDAKRKSIERQKEWLIKTKGVSEKDAHSKAVRIVEQDIQEGNSIGVSGVPMLINENGNILSTIPDLKP